VATGRGQLLVQHSIVLNISLSWRAKKKESKNSHDSCLGVGDRVSVANHGNHWIQLAKFCSIDKSTKLAVVK
jgi:hypothetical protein